MSFHLLAFVDPDAAANAYVDLAAVEDGVFLNRNGHFAFGEDLMLIAALATSTTLDRARVVTPSLRAVAAPQIRPINLGVELGEDPHLSELLEAPVHIRATEEVSVEGYHTAGVNEPVYGLLWVTRTLKPRPSGSIITVRGTSSQDATTDAWTSAAVTWEEELPRGRFGVVGSECVSDPPGGGGGAIAHRWTFDDSTFRPGATSVGAMRERTHRYFYDGRLGLWGVFKAPVMPRLEVLCSGASPDHTVFLHVVRMD